LLAWLRGSFCFHRHTIAVAVAVVLHCSTDFAIQFGCTAIASQALSSAPSLSSYHLSNSWSLHVEFMVVVVVADVVTSQQVCATSLRDYTFAKTNNDYHTVNVTATLKQSSNGMRPSSF